MGMRNFLLLGSSILLLSACGGGGKAPRAVPADPATNDNGTPVTAVLTARFDPSNGVLPLPNNLLFSGSRDLTLNPPVADPADPSAGPTLALSALDGWGTVTPWSAGFSGTINPASVVPGQTVRMFEVSLLRPGGPVTGVVAELTPGVDYVATVNTANPAEHAVAVVPLRPLQEISSYLVVITNGVADAAGNQASADQTYFIAQRDTPLVDANGQSTDPLLPDATAQALEPLRQLTGAQEAAATSQGIDPDSIVLSWVATTQSVTPVLNAARADAVAQFSQLAPTGLTTALIGAAGVADIYIGIISLPYYQGAPSANNPTAPLNQHWRASPGAYVAPFDQLGLDPASTHLTYLNPRPVVQSVQTVPLLVTIPNQGSGRTRPANGWPVVIFQHGITRNRTDALAIADSMALAGFAVVAIDQPLHGVASEVDAATGAITGPEANPLYIENTPFATLAGERTFDVDYIDNRSGAPGPDGAIDGSGSHTINLTSLLTSRDNLRQASADLAVLTATVPTLDLDGDGGADFDAARIAFVGQSLGAMVGTAFLALEPNVSTGVLSVPGGGIFGLLVGSPSLGPRLLSGLAASGLQPGTAEFNSFAVAAQTVIDSGDPINWGRLATATNAILLQEMIGSGSSLADQVIPNRVASFPLSGTEPLISTLGLAPITQSTQDVAGVRGVARFLIGGHGSLLSPAASLEATAEMQGQAVSMVLTNGTMVQVTIPSILQGN